MKKTLLLMMCCPMILSAQNGVTISNLDVKPGTVTFNVSWKNTGMPMLWSDSVWVFVDYNNASKIERLPITSATVSAGTVEIISGNNKGVRLIGNARAEGSFSATVQLLTATADLSGICAYASNYPPVGERTEANKITFTGTPEYNIVLKHDNGTTDTLQSGKIFYVPYGDTLMSFSDKTGAPGIIRGNLSNTPPGALTTRTWVIGSQTWSDALALPLSNCTETNNLTSTNPPITALYRAVNLSSGSGYLYNWKCVSDNANRQICPYPWRVPTYYDICEVDREVFARLDCNRRQYSDHTAILSAMNNWGAAPGSYAEGTENVWAGIAWSYWTMSSINDTEAHIYWLDIKFDWSDPHAVHPKNIGNQVRCVK